MLCEVDISDVFSNPFRLEDKKIVFLGLQFKFALDS